MEDLVDALEREVQSLRKYKEESEKAWMEVAGHLTETYAGGPKNLPACVGQMAERLRAANSEAAGYATRLKNAGLW